MLDKLKHIIGSEKAAGLEIIFLTDNSVQIHLMLLEIKSKLLSIQKKIVLDRLDQITDHVSADFPISVVLNGKGILHKKISGAKNKIEALQSILPNANSDDFYFQEYRCDADQFISIVRKSIIEELFSVLKAKGLFIVSLSLGGFQGLNLFPFIKIEGDVWRFSGHNLSMHNQHITDYKYVFSQDEGTVNIDNELLENTFILSYAAAFAELLHPESNISVEDAFFTEQSTEFKNSRIFKMAGMGILCLFLLILMINFFVLDGYRKEIEKLSSEEAHYSGVLTKANLIEKEVKEKELFLSEAGWFSAARESFYADRIAASVPSTILLHSLRVNPLDEKESRAKKKNVFLTGIIVISGECARATDLNPWLQKLKQIEEVNKAEVINYTFDNKERKGIFNIQLEVND